MVTMKIRNEVKSNNCIHLFQITQKFYVIDDYLKREKINIFCNLQRYLPGPFQFDWAILSLSL